MLIFLKCPYCRRDLSFDIARPALGKKDIASSVFICHRCHRDFRYVFPRDTPQDAGDDDGWLEVTDNNWENWLCLLRAVQGIEEAGDGSQRIRVGRATQTIRRPKNRVSRKANLWIY